ncbi:MAG: hypothetical protein L0241_19635 [Planctomycetia bacterium]|nr:hypothetical protein [Planctomycetia bacterium]
MPTEPEKKRPSKKRRRAKPKEDEFVVFEVDGFAQLTPEQRKWPVVNTGLPAPEAEREPNPPANPPN